jgi:hypothetical protein
MPSCGDVQQVATVSAVGLLDRWLDDHPDFVVTPGGETRHRGGERLPAHPALPGLGPAVDRFFRQLG